NGDGSAASIYGNATAGALADKDKEIEHLKELLKEKERTIQILMKQE
ncbi:XRE family transcriptional regulator, partial [Xanthomonas citri pv. citri]|nr:XRE family transcriptional regulator [Xanthomonas citri pv. citri]